MKVIVEETGSAALYEELAGWPGYVSSALLGVEAVRACRRLSEEVAEAAEARLTDLALVPISGEVLTLARLLDPRELRSLDAIHLATVLSIRDDLGAVFCYDDRLAAATTAAGMRVLAPR